MQIFVAQLINGIATGSVYALLVTGYNLLLLVRGIFQFSLAHIVVLSMYIIWLVMHSFSGDPILGVALGITAGISTAILVNILVEPLFRRMVLRGVHMESVVVAIGASIILTNIMSRFLNNGAPITFPSILTGEGYLITLGLASFSRADILALLGSCVVVIALFYLLYRTQLGRSFRAMAQDINKARIVGIPTTKMSLVSFTIAGLVAGISGILLAMILGYAHAGLANTLAVLGLSIVLVAGAGNLIGGLITAFIIGVAQSLTVTYVPGDWSDAIVFGAMLIIIISRSKGLFGEKV